MTADQGLADAQFIYSSICANGNGVPQGYVQAYRWFTLAANQGHENAKKLTGINFLASRRLKVYIHLHPTEHNFSSERAIGSQPPFSRPQELSARLPEPAFSNTSPFLWDIGIIFLGAAG